MKKKIRNEVYKLALNDNERIDIAIQCNVGLCWLLSKHNMRVYNNWHADEYKDAKIPELWLFVQDVFLPFGDITSAEKWEIRKIILEFCIEMTR